jgi:hypothetical protein
MTRVFAEVGRGAHRWVQCCYRSESTAILRCHLEGHAHEGLGTAHFPFMPRPKHRESAATATSNTKAVASFGAFVEPGTSGAAAQDPAQDLPCPAMPREYRTHNPAQHRAAATLSLNGSWRLRAIVVDEAVLKAKPATVDAGTAQGRNEASPGEHANPQGKTSRMRHCEQRVRRGVKTIMSTHVYLRIPG